ncbi:MAG: hypothetical protein C0498_01585 [Anaerolinea sp.]|nr:hypothetical protein [Anaerolinea sp.]
MNPRGIPIAQIESTLEGDPKFLRLVRALPGAAYYTALGVYTSIALRAWATASREVDADLFELLPAESVDALKAVGLLDEGGALPVAVFDRWPGSVLRLRQADADRKRGTPKVSAGVQRKPTDSNVEERRVEESRETEGSTIVSPSGALAAFGDSAASRNDRQWVEYVVEHGVSSRDRLTRVAEFYAARFGRPLPPDRFPRLAKAVTAHPGGLPGLMADLSEAALRGVAGDPLDWIAGKLRRSGGRQAQGITQPGGYDAVARSGD